MGQRLGPRVRGDERVEKLVSFLHALFRGDERVETHPGTSRSARLQGRPQRLALVGGV